MNAPTHFGRTECSGPSAITNGLSVDVEDWFQVGAFETVIERDEWDGIKTRVEDNVARIIDLFAQAEVQATFFTLGWVAKRHPALIRRIADAGHEIASHGYDHARVFTFDRKGFGDDISLAREILQDCSGRRVSGYRAPSFSIDQRTPWAFMELAEQGYAYSSSVAPIAHDHYGWPEAPRFAFRPIPWAELVEIPVTTAILGGRRVAAGGGGFFRVLLTVFHAGQYGRSIAAINARRFSTSTRGKLIPSSHALQMPQCDLAFGITRALRRWLRNCAIWSMSFVGVEWMSWRIARQSGRLNSDTESRLRRSLRERSHPHESNCQSGLA